MFVFFFLVQILDLAISARICSSGTLLTTGCLPVSGRGDANILTKAPRLKTYAGSGTSVQELRYTPGIADQLPVLHILLLSHKMSIIQCSCKLHFTVLHTVSEGSDIDCSLL